MNKLIAPAAATLLIATAISAEATPVTWTFITTNCTALFGGSCKIGEPTPPGMYVPLNLSLTLPGPTSSGRAHWGQPALPDFSSGKASSRSASYNTYRNGSEVGSATSTSYTDSGLSAKTSYTYAVIAVNPAGESAQSSAVTATSPDTRSGAIPAPPTGLTVSSTTTSSVTLTWNASTGATLYDVYRSGTKVGSSASTSYTDDGLSPGTTYTYAVTAVSTNYVYTVTAVNSSGESAESQTVKAATQPQAVTAPLTLHYEEGRITGPQYRQLGLEYGHYTPFTLYLCGSTWTNSSTCGSLH
jgi:chitodextrinase